MSLLKETMQMTSIPAWVSLSGKMAPFAAFVVFIAPYPTIRNINKERSAGNLPLLPYSSMVVNCYVWTIYGLLKSESKIWLTNMIGCILGLVYSTQFFQYCPANSFNLPGTKSQHKQIAAIIIMFTTLCAVVLPTTMSIRLIGMMGVFFCVVLFGSPLSSLKTVIQTKSAKSIQLPFTLACMVNCGLWSIFGTMEAKDFNIYFPNILGLILGFVQLFFIMLYGNGHTANYSQTLPIWI